MNPQKLLFVLLMSLPVWQAVHAQTIQYTYDATGNRVNRTIVVGGGGQKSMSIYNETTGTVKEEFKPEETFEDVLGELEITIYPNPNSGQMVVQIDNIPADVRSLIIVYDLAGKTIYRKQNLSPYTDVDITNSPNGTYILKIAVGKEVSKWKVIKK